MTEHDVETTESIAVFQDIPDQLDSIIVSYGDRVTKPITHQKLSWIVEQIRGSESLRDHITTIRSLSSAVERSERKKSLLPHFLFASFRDNKRLNECFERTRFVIIDIDHIGEGLSTTKQKMISDEDIFILKRNSIDSSVSFSQFEGKLSLSVNIFRKIFKNE